MDVCNCAFILGLLAWMRTVLFLTMYYQCGPVDDPDPGYIIYGPHIAWIWTPTAL
jgi:hypothetical protein